MLHSIIHGLCDRSYIDPSFPPNQTMQCKHHTNDDLCPNIVYQLRTGNLPSSGNADSQIVLHLLQGLSNSNALHTLVLDQTQDLGDAGVAALSECIAGTGSMPNANIGLGSSLCNLRLSSCRLTDTQLQCLCEVLVAAPHNINGKLVSLDLSNNSFGNLGPLLGVRTYVSMVDAKSHI